jgi:hypothetical protein
MLPAHGMVYFSKPRQRVYQTFNQALVQWQ